MDKYKIVADSSADTYKIDGVPFAYAPLKIITSEREFTDNESLNLSEMTSFLSDYKGKSSSSCPNPEDWLSAFGESENIFCISISATLSGSYNAALTAKEIYLESHPQSNILVINTLSCGPELILLIEKLRDYISEGLEFNDICEKISEYQKSTGLLFMLESMKNLANNGRVSQIAAKAAGLLGIRVVGKASDNGDLQQLSKCRGEDRALGFITDFIVNDGAKNGKIRIDHCQNLETAQKLADIFKAKIPDADITINSAKGLCCFYAEQGGLLIGYEKF